MSLKQKIDADIKTAMLAKNKEELEALRSIKSMLTFSSSKTVPTLPKKSCFSSTSLTDIYQNSFRLMNLKLNLKKLLLRLARPVRRMLVK